jgi:hypothetical protein
MRGLYEGYAEALGNYLYMPLPPWIADQPHKDNWLAVSKLRARTESASASLARAIPVEDTSRSIATLVDDHHNF